MDSYDLAPGDSHAEADENYFISMTDMMVGVLFIFIILLMVFALNFRSQTDISEERLAQLREAALKARQIAEEVSSVQGRIEQQIKNLNESDQVRANLLREVQKRLAEEGLQITVDEVNGVLRLGENAVNFDLESSELRARAKENVTRIANVLAEVLPRYTSQTSGLPAYIETVFIEGHTDKTGSDERNWILSTERAVNTYRSMIATTPVLRELHNRSGKEIFSVSGYSDTRPVPGISVDKYEAQRRIDLRFVMDVDDKDRLASVLQLSNSMKERLGELQETVNDVDVDW